MPKAHYVLYTSTYAYTLCKPFLCWDCDSFFVFPLSYVCVRVCMHEHVSDSTNNSVSKSPQLLAQETRPLLQPQTYQHSFYCYCSKKGDRVTATWSNNWHRYCVTASDAIVFFCISLSESDITNAQRKQTSTFKTTVEDTGADVTVLTLPSLNFQYILIYFNEFTLIQMRNADTPFLVHYYKNETWLYVCTTCKGLQWVGKFKYQHICLPSLYVKVSCQNPFSVGLDLY